MKEAERKAKIAKFNRLLGWFTFVAFLLPRVEPLLSTRAGLNLPAGLISTLNVLFMFFFFIHGIAGVYLYGVPRFKWESRVLQMLLGFVIIGLFILNRAFVFVPFLSRLTEILLWVPIGFHVLLGFWYLIRRIVSPSKYTSTRFYLGGPIVRDF